MMKYLKKLSCILIVVLIFTSSMVVTTSASTSRCTWEINGDTLTITGDGDVWGFDGGMGSAYPFAPNEWKTVSKVVIQEGITKIPAHAFGSIFYPLGLPNIKSVIIPESVTSIGFSAFYGCTGLTTISIPDGVTPIGEHAFRECTTLTAINIPKSMTTIGVGAFYNCGHLVDVYYNGTEEEWKKVFIGANNEVFLRATMHFEQETVDSSKLFSDVPADAWYKEYTDYAVTYKILNGSGDGKLNPEKTITRAEFVQVLANLSGVDTTNKNVKTRFNDVKSGEWYAPAVKWAAENGIVDGMSPTTFAPNEKITREQMCTMLVRYIEKYLNQQLSKTNEKKIFADDSSISGWAKDYVYACQQAGLVNGVSPTEFAPQVSANRASVAALMTRFHQNYLK